MKYSFKKILHAEIKGLPHECQWAAFLLPVFLLSVAFSSWKVYPVGNTSLLTCDLFHQYAPILAEIRSKILSGESLFYTWNMGLGTNFWPILSYNGASPLNAILLLFPQSHLSDGITLMILLRTGLSGLFFSLLLYKKDGREGAVTLAISTVYALCGYVLSYFWALMWMDAVVLLPLVILGLWKIITGEKSRLYVITLFLVIFSNFYSGFFICLFLVVFAPVLYLEARQRSASTLHPAKAGLSFAGHSLLAAGMSAILIVPTVLALSATSAASDTIQITNEMSFSFFDFISQFLLHTDPVIREGLPNVYCSVVILLLIPMYAFCQKISFSQRAASLTLSLFLYMSMNSHVLNFFWHGMHYTNQLPFRQSFLLCFLLLYMASQVLMHFDGLSKRTVYYAGFCVLCYLVLLNHFGEMPKNYWLIYGSAAFVIAHSIILSVFFAADRKRIWAQKAFLYAIILEMFFASEFALSYIEKTEHFTYAPSYGQYSDLISKEISAEDKESFSRTVILPSVTGNDGALYHVKTISIFASTTSASYVQFMAGLGFANNQAFELEADGLTDVSARILGIRHVVNFTGEKSIQESRTDDTISAAAAVLGASSANNSPKTDVMYSGYNITTNEKVLPLGFFVPSEGVLTTLDSKLSPFEQTNALLESMGTHAVYDKRELKVVSSSNIEQSTDANAYSIQPGMQTASISFTPMDVSGSGNVLLFLGTEQNATVRITCIDRVTGEKSFVELAPFWGQIIDCGIMPNSGEGTMTIQLLFSDPYPETFPIYCCLIDEDALDSATETLASQPYTVTSYDSSHLAGSVDFAKDGSLFTSIPYDAGWTVKVDGKVVKTQAAYGAFISVPILKGFHSITFSYQPPGFLPGLLISVILTADFVFLCIWNPIPYLLRRRMESIRSDKKEEQQ